MGTDLNYEDPFSNISFDNIQPRSKQSIIHNDDKSTPLSEQSKNKDDSVQTFPYNNTIPVTISNYE